MTQIVCRESTILTSVENPQPPNTGEQHLDGEHSGLVMPFKLRSPARLLRFIHTATIFGKLNDVTLQ